MFTGYLTWGRGVLVLIAFNCSESLLITIYYMLLCRVGCFTVKSDRKQDSKMTNDRFLARLTQIRKNGGHIKLVLYCTCMTDSSPSLSFWEMAAATWSAQTTWWRRSTMSAVKSSKPRSDASSCSMMCSCVPRLISGKSDHKPALFLICPLICTFPCPWV